MSFGSIFGGIKKGLAIAGTIGIPIARGFFPAGGPIFDKLDRVVAGTLNSIARVEIEEPRSGQGGLKKDLVIADFETGLEEMQSILAFSNKKLVYDEGELKSAIDKQVEAFNHFAKVKASFRVVDLAANPAPPNPPNG